jgi:hypothetical protein
MTLGIHEKEPVGAGCGFSGDEAEEVLRLTLLNASARLGKARN